MPSNRSKKAEPLPKLFLTPSPETPAWRFRPRQALLLRQATTYVVTPTHRANPLAASNQSKLRAHLQHLRNFATLLNRVCSGRLAV